MLFLGLKVSQKPESFHPKRDFVKSIPEHYDDEQSCHGQVVGGRDGPVAGQVHDDHDRTLQPAH
jgi:hypothetical protein